MRLLERKIRIYVQVSFMTISVALEYRVQQKMPKQLVNNELEGGWKETLFSNLRHHPSTFLEENSKTIFSRPSNIDMNQRPSTHDVEVSAAEQRCWVFGCRQKDNTKRNIKKTKYKFVY